MSSPTMVDESVANSIENPQQVEHTTDGFEVVAHAASRITIHRIGDKIWDYFKQSNYDQSKAMCLLCSKELYHHEANNSEVYDKLAKNANDKNNNNVLWDHLKTKHLIEKETNDCLNHRNTNGDVHKSTSITSTVSAKLPDSNPLQTHTNQPIMTSTASRKKRSQQHQHHKHNRFKESSNVVKKSSTLINGHKAASSTVNKVSQETTKLRKNLDLMDYSDLTCQPSASSTSISKNFLSRLNEFSSPVARKLKFWNKKSFQVNQYDPSFKVVYLGNLGMQFLSKDEQCLEKPLNTLWNNYLVYMKTEIVMRLTICNSGLKAITRQHGLTQYWSNRLVYCFTHKNYPKIFSWIYRHEGKKMRQELRCHAVFCSSPEKASKMVSLLNQRLACALQEFKREKKSREPPSIMTKSDRSSNNSSSVKLLQQTLPRTVPLRRQILAKGSANFRPPLDRSKSAPKLTSIREEDYDESDLNESDDEDDDQSGGSRDEFEYAQSFGDRDDELEDEEDQGDALVNDDFDYDENELDKFVDKLKLGLESESAEWRATQKVESDSLLTTVNEVTSNCSSVCATGDSSYDNQLAHDSDRLSATPPSKSLSRRNSMRRNCSTSSSSRVGGGRSNKIEAGVASEQKEVASQLAACKSSHCDSLSQKLTDTCHITCGDRGAAVERQTSANSEVATPQHGNSSSLTETNDDEDDDELDGRKILLANFANQSDAA